MALATVEEALRVIAAGDLLGSANLRLTTKDPAKRDGTAGFGLSVAAREPPVTKPNPEGIGYLRARQEKSGHAPELGEADARTLCAC